MTKMMYKNKKLCNRNENGNTLVNRRFQGTSGTDKVVGSLTKDTSEQGNLCMTYVQENASQEV